MPPAGQWSNAISFQAPATSGPFPLQFELRDATNVVFTNTISCSALPRTTLAVPPGLKIGLYDPAGATASLFQRFGLPYITVTPTFSICPKHGYLAGEHEFCPRCDEDLLERKRREAEAA